MLGSDNICVLLFVLFLKIIKDKDRSRKALHGVHVIMGSQSQADANIF